MDSEPMAEGDAMKERRAEAARRVRAAVGDNEARLSDVFYDSHDYVMHEAHNGWEFDGERDNGYDPDDLAALLWPVLSDPAVSAVLDAAIERALRPDTTQSPQCP